MGRLPMLSQELVAFTLSLAMVPAVAQQASSVSNTAPDTPPKSATSQACEAGKKYLAALSPKYTQNDFDSVVHSCGGNRQAVRDYLINSPAPGTAPVTRRGAGATAKQSNKTDPKYAMCNTWKETLPSDASFYKEFNVSDYNESCSAITGMYPPPTAVPVASGRASTAPKHVIVKTHGFDYDCTQAKVDYTTGPESGIATTSDKEGYNHVCSELTGAIPTHTGKGLDY